MHLCTHVYVSMRDYNVDVLHFMTNTQTFSCANLYVLSLSPGKLHESVEKVSELQRTGFSNTGIDHLD